MNTNDWFRRTRWSDSDATEFTTRLAEVRSPAERVRCLLTQARCLQETGDQELINVAIALLDEWIANDPHLSNLAAAHDLRGDALVDVGRPIEAIDAFREAIRIQHAEPEYRSRAYLTFGELIVKLGRKDLYDEMQEALLDLDDDMYPVDSYAKCYLWAVLSEHEGDEPRASGWARLALAWTPGLSTLFRPAGDEEMVRPIDPDAHDWLVRMAQLHPDYPYRKPREE